MTQIKLLFWWDWWEPIVLVKIKFKQTWGDVANLFKNPHYYRTPIEFDLHIFEGVRCYKGYKGGVIV